jgi:hypothetical protein
MKLQKPKEFSTQTVKIGHTWYILSLLLLSLVLVCVLLFIHTCLLGHDTPFSALCILPSISGAFPRCSNGIPYDACAVSHQPNQIDQGVKTDVLFTCILDEHFLDLDERELVLEIMHAKILTMDLLTLVRISNLGTKTKFTSLLAELAEGFTEAGRVLQRFASKVRGLDDR